MSWEVPHRTSEDDPRNVQHWLAQRPGIPLVVDSCSETISDLHVELKNLSGSDESLKRWTRGNYRDGAISPLPCTELTAEGRTIALVNSGALALGPVGAYGCNDRWRALFHATAVLCTDPARGGYEQDIIRLAKAFDVPVAIALSPEGREERVRKILAEDGYHDAIILSGSRRIVAERLLVSLAALRSRPFPKAGQPLELLVASSGSWSKTDTLIEGIVLAGRPAVGQCVVVKHRTGTTQTEVIKVFNSSVANADVYSAEIVIRLPPDTEASWLCHVDHQSLATERLDRLVETLKKLAPVSKAGASSPCIEW